MNQTVVPFKSEQEYYTAVFDLIRETLQAYDVFLKQTAKEEKQSARSDAAASYELTLKAASEKRDELYSRAADSMKNRMAIPAAYVIKTFCSDDFMTHCFLLALAGELDSGFGSLYAAYPENDKQIHPTFDFCVRTYTPWQERQISLQSRYYQEKAYGFDLLFDFSDPLNKFPLYRKMVIRRSIVSFIMDFGNPDNSLSDFVQTVYPSDVNENPMISGEKYLDSVKRIADVPEQLIIHLTGPDGCGRKTIAANYFAGLGKICLCINMAAFKKEFLAEIICEAKLKNAGICLCNLENAYDKSELFLNRILRELLKISPVIFLSSGEKYPYEKSRIPAVMTEVAVGYPSMEEKIELWNASFTETGLSKVMGFNEALSTDLSARFTFTPGQIKAAARDAVISVIREGYREELVYRACFARLNHRLGEKAMRVESHYTFDDLVLAPASKKMLTEACNQIRFRRQVYELWGFDEKIAYGRGVSMLFSGAPGTGKTMAAQVIANYLHMELYKVDLSAVMSKYIGETQKSLNEIFEEVRKSESILFFDEADALFAKRSEISGSNDRYANSETAYLLEKMEEYEGVVILATNYVQNFDTAFKRRIKFIIEFALPGFEERLEIWKNIFPEKVPLEEIPDYNYLARTFGLSGSNIKNIAVASAFRAAASARGIRMEDILISIREEVGKTGKHLHNSEFLEYAPLLEKQI